jgi:hypothetical protein
MEVRLRDFAERTLDAFVVGRGRRLEAKLVIPKQLECGAWQSAFVRNLIKRRLSLIVQRRWLLNRSFAP